MLLPLWLVPPELLLLLRLPQPTAVASVEVSTSMIAAGGIKLLEFMLEPLLLLPELGKFAGRVVD